MRVSTTNRSTCSRGAGEGCCSVRRTSTTSEDFDLSWRGRARGWRYRYVPTALQRHMHAATSGEGSPVFTHFVERNRLFMLTKNAPRPILTRAILGYLTATASYARRDVVRPLVHGQRPRTTLVRRRLKAFAAWLKLVPDAVGDRRRLRQRQTVPDAALTGWAVSR
jgi:N-acetylglucosaminyl-diphospho-decaprenol L-rhamnosyltransferase